MKIIITGNIGSGKSTLITSLAQSCGPEANLHQIDQYRRSFSDSTPKGDEYATTMFLSSIPVLDEPTRNIHLIELTGVGSVANRLAGRLQSDRDITSIFFLSVAYPILVARLRSNFRQKQLTPFPGTSSTLKATLDFIQNEIARNGPVKIWQQLPLASVVLMDNHTEEQGATNRSKILEKIAEFGTALGVC